MLSRVIPTRLLQDELNRPCQIASAQVRSTAEIAAFETISTGETRRECDRFPFLSGLHTSSEVLV